MSQSTVLKQNREICKYCEHCRFKQPYMTYCKEHKKVTFLDSTCDEFSREPGSDDDLGDCK